MYRVSDRAHCVEAQRVRACKSARECALGNMSVSYRLLMCEYKRHTQPAASSEAQGNHPYRNARVRVAPMMALQTSLLLLLHLLLLAASWITVIIRAP